MKRKFLILILILILILSGFIYALYPIKFGVKYEDINKEKNYIIVSPCTTTIAQWIIIEINGDICQDEIYVRLSENEPSGFNYEVEAGVNKFVCYGDFIEDGDFYGERYLNFIVSEWDIIIPIKRVSIFDCILPKKYLCNLDKQ